MRKSALSKKSGIQETVETVNGLEFVLQRKKVKNLNMRIRQNGDVYVSAPSRMPIAEIKEFVASKSAWIDEARIKYGNSPLAKADEASADEKDEWRQAVSATAPVLIEEWSDILGVKAGKIVYREMRSRWGSCQPATGRICLNTRLALFPPECLEYVVVHELCHLLIRGHGKDFHELMDSVMPDWKSRRAKLR